MHYGHSNIVEMCFSTNNFSNFPNSYWSHTFCTSKIDGWYSKGSVLSPLLFTMTINNIQSYIRYLVKHHLYADDLVLFIRGNNFQILQTDFQSTINKPAVWGDKHGLFFALSKNKLINLIKKRK